MDNIAVCPVCSQDYKVEGSHVPRILACFHTVCEGCIRNKLCKGSSLECPQCGTVHSAESGIENIPENEYIISHIKKMVERSPVKKSQTKGWERECQKHGKIQSIFCNESECQMPICLMCLKDDHKAHDFSDLEEVAEERCAILLEDVRSMKETLQKEKEEFLAVQKIVAQNCQECILEINSVKADLISEIDKRAMGLVFDITEHKKKVDTSVNKLVVNIDEKLGIVKDLETITNTATIFEVKPEKLEKLKDTKKQIQSTFSETKYCTALTYKKCGDMSKHLSSLCGKLTHKNKQLSAEIIQNFAKYVSQETHFNDNNKVMAAEERILSSSSLLQINTNADIPIVAKTDASHEEYYKRTDDILVDEDQEGESIITNQSTVGFIQSMDNTSNLNQLKDSTVRNDHGKNTPPGETTLDAPDDNEAEPVAKKARLESTPNGNSQTNYQRPWQGKIQHLLKWEGICFS